jgi:hypothetical protein
MRKLKLFLLAAALTALAITSIPKTASANMWCDQCAAGGDCISCCRCQGFGFPYCARTCP